MNRLTDYGASERFFAESSLYPDWEMARVVSQHKELYHIVTADDKNLAEVSGRFRHTASAVSDYPVVGDFVMTQAPAESEGNAVIHRVLTRKSSFERSAVGNDEQTQIIAANIDIVFICMALNQDYNLSRLERYLSVAWNSQATPVVLLTKADLCADLDTALVETAAVAIGVDILALSSQQPASLQQLRPYLGTGITASFVGSSGVGKSTLINGLIQSERLATAAIRSDGKGRHTTTRRELLLLPSGGVVIDTPGMRELGAESVDLSRSFADIDTLVGQCKFRDCAHECEPGCAVRAAIETGELDPRRLENYRKLQREARYDGLSAKEIETEKLTAMFGSMSEMKKFRDHYKRKNKQRLD